MPKRYLLQSEIERTRKNRPSFELVIPHLDARHEGEGEARVEVRPEYPERTLSIPSAALLPDDVVLYSGTQPVRAARTLLGDAYDHYVAAGGTANLLMSIIQEDAQGATPGE